MTTTAAHRLPLTQDEVAALPRMTPAWLAAVAAANGGILLGFVVPILLRNLLIWADRQLNDLELHWTLAIPLVLAVLVGIWLPLYPLLRRVGYGWGTLLLLALIPCFSIWIGISLGWRLARLPWRDWPPHSRERPVLRQIPGSSFYVLPSDLERIARRRARRTSTAGA